MRKLMDTNTKIEHLTKFYNIYKGQAESGAAVIARQDEEIEKLRAALSWMEDHDPQLVEAARLKFSLAAPSLRE